MNHYPRVLVNIICESILEEELIALIKRYGVLGYTLFEVRGEGSRGLRDGDFEYSKNIKCEILCKPETADKICQELHDNYFDDYALIIFTQEVSVLRDTKFK